MPASMKMGRLPKWHARTATMLILLVLLAALLCLSCENPYIKSRGRRARMAQEKRGDIRVAVVWPSQRRSDDRFLQGVELAAEEVNAAGGVLGRKLRVIHFDEPIDTGDTVNTNRITSDPRIVAVVGHYLSDPAISASICYEYHGIVFLAPSATAMALTTHGFGSVFRTIASDRVFGERLAQYARGKGYRDILVLDDNTVYGKGLAAVFHEKATNLGIQVVGRYGYFQWEEDYRALIEKVGKLKFDGVFLAGSLPQGAHLIRQFREMDLHTPFIAGDALDSPALIQIAGKAAEGVVVPTDHNNQSSDPDFLRFKEAFSQRFQAPPDGPAAQGYDSIMLLAHAMGKGSSSIPVVVASVLRHELKWKGVLQEYSFDDTGELDNVKVFFKQVSKGQFVFKEE